MDYRNRKYWLVAIYYDNYYIKKLKEISSVKCHAPYGHFKYNKYDGECLIPRQYIQQMISCSLKDIDQVEAILKEAKERRVGLTYWIEVTKELLGQ